MKRSHTLPLGSSILALMISCALGCGESGQGTSSSSAAASSGQGGGASSSGAGGSGTGGAETGGAGTGGSTAAPQQPDAASLPKATGPCPDFTEGTITVTPDGKARDVRVWISDAAKTLDGPLLFYWHGTNSSPITEPPYGIGAANVAALKEKGGIIVAPFHDPAAGTFPWFLTTGSGPEDDLRVADEVVACAIEKVGIDIRRIHSMGMSAGGLQTTQMSYRRSG